MVKSYYDYMVDTAVTHGADRQRAEIEMKDALEFEAALANVSQFIILFFLKETSFHQFLFIDFVGERGP